MTSVGKISQETKLMYGCKVNIIPRLIPDHALVQAKIEIILFSDEFCHKGPRPLGFYPD